MMLEGIRNNATTGVMLMFAILYFGIMIDAGLFEPFVRYRSRQRAGRRHHTSAGEVVFRSSAETTVLQAASARLRPLSVSVRVRRRCLVSGRGVVDR